MLKVAGPSTLLAVTIVMAGCTIHRPAESPQPLVNAAAPYVEGIRADDALSGWDRPWWTIFQDEELNELTSHALQANFDLEQFRARIEQARALLRQSGSRLWPAMDATGDYERRWIRPELGGSTRESALSLGGFLSWEIDFWGRLRSARSAQLYQAKAVENDLQAARLLLSASVAETYFEIREQRRQLSLIRAQIQANETLLDLTRLRFGQGQSSIVDLLQQQEQLAATISLVPAVEARVEELEYALDVLIGMIPGTRPRLQDRNWRTPPPIAGTGIPSDLLQRRPDLVAAENRVRSLDYRVGEAIAARLPQVTIGGSVSALGDPSYNALVSSLFANIAGPVFDAGLRKAEVDLQRARLTEAVAEWSESYLSAIRDVETALMQERKQTELVKRTEEQLEIARRLLRETRNRYAQGLTDYLPVLNAVVTQQNLERESLRTRRELLSFRIGVHRALGGPMPPMYTAEQAGL